MAFHLHIDSIEDFVKFVAVITGEDLDSEDIKKLTEELNKDSDALIEAEKKDGG